MIDHAGAGSARMTVITSQRKGITMGCDIHLFVEKRVPATAAGPAFWTSADTWEPYPDDWKDEADQNKDVQHVPYGKAFYTERNYDLFAILADVRNGRGFAGCDTGEGFVPISAPRGLPFDVSDPVKAESDRWDVDGHSHSYFTVAELMAYDWTQVTTKRGWVDAVMFWSWCNWGRDEGEGPRGYSGGVWGRDIEHVEPDVMEGRIKGLLQAHPSESGRRDRDHEDEVIAKHLSSVYTQVAWTTPYYRAAHWFLGTVLPRLWRLGAPQDVRIVFWFDN